MTPQQRDAAYIDAHLQRLHARAEALGRPVVLVQNRCEVDFYESVVEAIRDGFARFGADPFYVRELSEPRVTSRVASTFAV